MLQYNYINNAVKIFLGTMPQFYLSIYKILLIKKFPKSMTMKMMKDLTYKTRYKSLEYFYIDVKKN